MGENAAAYPLPGADIIGQDTRHGRSFHLMQAEYPAYDGMEPCVEAPDMFYPENLHGYALTQAYDVARSMCEECPVRVECARWGIAHELDGMWGGLTPKERQRIRSRRGIMVNSLPPPDTYLPSRWVEEVGSRVR